MKFEYKKLPEYSVKTDPELLVFPTRKYLTINGEGNPNGEEFQKRTEAIYSASYGIKMPFKKSEFAKNGEFDDYVVPPMEGYWSITADAAAKGTFTKDDFIYQIRLAIPDFVPDEFVEEKLTEAKNKNADNPYAKDVKYGVIEERKVIEILHIGSYDDEPKSFAKIDEYLKIKDVKRISKNHVEIYLSDPRKTEPEKLKTILQVEVKQKLL